MYRKILTVFFMLFGMWVFGQKIAYNMLVGTFTNGVSEGIYQLSFDAKGGLISQSLLAKTDNPSFLAFSPDKKSVYAVNESGENSAVTAYSFDKEKPSLTFLNRISIGNAGPCFVTSTDKYVIVGNYGNGTISVLGIKSDGSLTDTVQTIVQKGKFFGRGLFGPSNVHQTLFSPNGKFLIVTNLGKDQVFTYAYNPNSKTEVLKQTDVAILPAHSGPRHAVFSKNGKYLYLLQELNAGITVFEVSEAGKLNQIQETTINQPNKQNSGAEIALSPDEKYLYASNRGDVNKIFCFKVEKNGTISEKNAYSTEGIAPRNFAISPDGKFIFIGNQKTDNVVVYKRNKCNGDLKLISKDIKIGAPVCLLFY